MFITALSLAALLLVEGTHAAGRPTGAILENMDSAQRISGLSDSQIALQGSGWLNEGEEVAFTVNLPAGQGYQIVGVCDRDCDDVDMWAADGDELLGGDLEPRGVVMFPLIAPASGTVTFTVSMPACAVEPCAYGYRVYPYSSGW